MREKQFDNVGFTLRSSEMEGGGAKVIYEVRRTLTLIKQHTNSLDMALPVTKRPTVRLLFFISILNFTNIQSSCGMSIYWFICNKTNISTITTISSIFSKQKVNIYLFSARNILLSCQINMQLGQFYSHHVWFLFKIYSFHSPLPQASSFLLRNWFHPTSPHQFAVQKPTHSGL